MNLHDTEWTLAGELTNRKRISDGVPAVQSIARAGERHAALKSLVLPREGRVYDPRTRDGSGEELRWGRGAPVAPSDGNGADGSCFADVLGARTLWALAGRNVTACPSRSESNDWHADW